jgi:protoporphyrinogen/coproporphyrinogen III oxidase
MLGRTIIGGSSLLPDAMARDLGDRLRLGARVLEVSATAGNEVEIRYLAHGKEHSLRARSAVVTTPSYVTREIVTSLPSDTHAALDRIRYGPSVLMGVLTSEDSSMPWDDLYAITVPDSAFNMFFNISHVLRSPGKPRKPGGSLMIYATGEPGRRLQDATDEEVTERFLADLYRLFPETREIIAETVIQRWPAAAPYTFPGRGKLQEALERRIDPIYLAGDYLGTSFTETAVVTGRIAAQRALGAG